MAQTIKNPPAVQETWVRSLGWEDPLRIAWQPTQVFLPGESPWAEEPGGLQFMGLQRVGYIYIVVYVCQSQSPNLSLPPSLAGNHKFIFYICNSVSLW